MSQNSWLYVNKPGIDFTRNRKMDFDNTIKFLISMQKSSTKQELLDFYHYDSDAPSQASFSQQRGKIRPDAFEFLFKEFTSNFSYDKKFKGYRLLACDGSRLNIARNPKDAKTYCLTDPYGKGFNQLHLNALYDLCNRVYVDTIIQPAREMNEGKAMCDMIDRFCQNSDDKAIFMADRGYETLNIFAHAIENQSRFLIRAKDVGGKTNLLSTLNLPDSEEFDVDIERFLTRRNTNKVKEQPEVYKYISNRPFDYLETGSSTPYYMAFRVIRFKISDGTYECIITNLPRSEFSVEDIKELYNLRWGIETSFRELKYAVGLVNFHSKKVDFITQEIFAKLILFNFCEIITSYVVIEKKDTIHQYQINYAIAIRICIEFLIQSRNSPPMNVETLIGRQLLPIRSGRKAPRFVKSQSAKSFIYR
jgi:hypothetical protein